MQFFILLTLLASAVAEYDVTYDNLTAQTPNILAKSLVYLGKPVTPNPYLDISYSDQFRVVGFTRSLLAEIDLPSPPNVLVSANVLTSAGTFSVSGAQSLNVRRICFACVTLGQLAALTPIPCTVLFSGSSASNPELTLRQLVAYDGSRTFAHALLGDLGFVDLDALTFTITHTSDDHGATGRKEVSLALDNFVYDVESSAKEPTTDPDPSGKPSSTSGPKKPTLPSLPRPFIPIITNPLVGPFPITDTDPDSTKKYSFTNPLVGPFSVTDPDPDSTETSSSTAGPKKSILPSIPRPIIPIFTHPLVGPFPITDSDPTETPTSTAGTKTPIPPSKTRSIIIFTDPLVGPVPIEPGSHTRRNRRFFA